ncbi:MAG: enoyl-CoA hydratase-related protein [Actinomycetota bacterium]|nr:enoyl-CoA hydratase-related protein [Actinomycetota bacterium]
MLSFYRAWLWHPKSGHAVHRGLNGAAVGAGLALALACDLRYATPEAGLSMPFTSLGIHPGMASAVLLPEVSGLAVARGNVVDRSAAGRADAVAAGLVNQGFPAESLWADVLEITSPMATRAPIAIRLTRQALTDGGHASFEAVLEWEAVSSAADDGDPGPARGDRGSAATTEPGVHRA